MSSTAQSGHHDGSDFVASQRITEFALWEVTEGERVPLYFALELTARCNNNCRHCFINLPADDEAARRRELSVAEIDALAKEAASLGALWCLVTGGEPLLRRDFCDVYMALKSHGLLPTVFTNACPVTGKHVELFKRYPPRDLEVSVYGVSRTVYERVTGIPGSYAAFRRGLDLLLEAGLKVTLKAVAIRSNMDELPAIAKFCRRHSSGSFRFDPMLQLRCDRNEKRNADIRAERLTPDEIVEIERGDSERYESIQRACDDLVLPEGVRRRPDQLFYCGAGLSTFTIGHDGMFRLCTGLCHPDCIYDLRQGSLSEAWNSFAPRIRALTTHDVDFTKTCGACPLVILGLCCPARVALETGRLDGKSDYFCRVAHARTKLLRPIRVRPRN